jgi:hypothetical protein
VPEEAISKGEQSRRAENALQSMHSITLEGEQVTEATKADLLAYVHGECDAAELRRRVVVRHTRP